MTLVRHVHIILYTIKLDIKMENNKVDSASNSRTVNNVMRHEYRVLDETEKDQMKATKDIGIDFYNLLDDMGESRELSLAKTKVEEAVMWAVKHVTK